MLWFFERQHSRFRYEIRRQTDGPGYELVITYPGGGQEVERYSDPGAVVERSMALQNALTEAGWAPPRIGPRAGLELPNRH